MTIKSLIKKILPTSILSVYHLILAWLGNFYYGWPSEKIIIIGVTGTNGKSTTVNLIAKIFDEAGFKSAATSTVNFKIGGTDQLNDKKMTMPGRFFLPRFLHNAIRAGCTHAVIESSSEGILQHRNMGIHYDAFVFTNLTPEHIESHGGFENYKNAKLEYFRQLQKSRHKFINGKKVPKIIAANFDDQYFKEFTNFQVEKIISFGQNPKANITGANLIATKEGAEFEINGVKTKTALRGKFDLYNCLAAIAICFGLGIDLNPIKSALEKTLPIPGRMELIIAGQNFDVLIDYAPEPESLRKMYKTVKAWGSINIIHVLGSTGGGRDVSRRSILGEIAGENANTVIITNEDPYDDDEQKIIDQVAEGVIKTGKILDQNLFKILDRREAIKKALSLAKAGDLVIITGKGAEQKMAVKNGYIDWDDRAVVREELSKLLFK